MDEEIHVLHVDDDPEFASMTADFLERVDDRFQTTVETDPRDALEAVHRGDVDCVVTDYRMPELDGVEFLERIREAGFDVPIVMFTGEGSEEVASEALSAGATEYLQKQRGIERYELLANRIENAVDHHRIERRVEALERVRSTLRDVNQALVRADSADEIERRVCEILAATEPIALAAVSGVDPATGAIEARTVAGDGAAFLEAREIVLTPDAERPPSPQEEAYMEHDIAVSSDLLADPSFRPWHAIAREHDLRSVGVVPLGYDRTLHGLLELYGTREETVEAEGRALLNEIGDDVGHALDAMATRRNLEASEERYRTLTGAISDVIVTMDADSTITFVNDAVTDLLGYEPHELRGESLTKLMPERFRDRHQAGVDRYLETGERELDWRGVELPGERADGTEIPLSISFGEFERAGEPMFTGVIRDVSERAEREEQLRRQNDYLDEFAGAVAHDLRNPLHVASGRLEQARLRRDDEDLAAVADNLDRMEALVDDLLALARDGQDDESLESVDLDAVVAAARRAVQDDPVTVGDADVTIDIEADLGTTLAHRGRVRELLVNLFRNAVEHGDDEVTVHVEALADGFAVADDGPGIPPAERGSVFDPGYTTKDGGTGFGLNIVAKIADAHGWEVTIADGIDGGARFEFTGLERPE